MVNVLFSSVIFMVKLLHFYLFIYNKPEGLHITRFSSFSNRLKHFIFAPGYINELLLCKYM